MADFATKCRLSDSMPTIVIGIFAAQVVDKLVDRKVFWRCGRLEVDEAFADDPNLLEDLSGCFVAVAQFRKFSASRFLTVATSMRPIVGCIALGLGALLDIIFQDKAQSQYYIRGAKRLSVSVRKYAVIASLAAWPTDAAMVHLMKDDRLARWVDSMDDDMKQELYYLSNLSDASWSLFDDVVGADPSPRVLRTEVLTAASISAAFVYRRAFRSAKSLPWTLTRGCIAENLRALAAGDMPDETISAKIWQLMRLGYNVKELTEALGLLAEARWSTKVVEQQHGSAAAMHKAHPSYTAESLSRRAFLHMVTALLPSPCDSDPQRNKIDRRIAALERQQPEKISGRHVFFGDFYQALKAERPYLSSDDLRTLAMKMHGAAFEVLPSETKTLYQQKAEQQCSEKRATIQDEIAHLKTYLMLKAERAAEEFEEECTLLRVSNCKFSNDMVASLQHRWGSEQYTFKEVRKHAVSSMVSPEVPSAEVRANLEQRMIRGPAIELRHDLPWRSKVAAFRDYFDMCALVFEGERGRSYFWFLFAMQSPIAIALAPLEPRDMIISSSHILDSIVPGGSLDVFDFNFDVAWGEFTLCDELKLTGNEKVWVLPHLVCTRENLVQSHANCVKLDVFLQGLPPSTRGAVSGCGSARGSHATSKPSEDILAMFPWLRTYTETSNAAKPPQDAVASRSTSTSVTIDIDEQELDRIRLSLEEKRLEWSDARIGVGDDFVVVVTGGPWANANLGVDYDAFRAKSRGGHPEMWCRMFGLPLSSSFTFAAYGEHNASVLAESWARKMQFWYRNTGAC